MRRLLALALLLATPPALARGSWSGSLHGAYTTSSGVPYLPDGLHGSWGVLGQGFRQFTPLFGLGLELGYTRYAVGRVVEPPYQDLPETEEERVHTLLQVSLALRLRDTSGPVRTRVSLSLGAYPTYLSGWDEVVSRYPSGAARVERSPLSGNDGGGPGAGLTLGVDVLPWRGRHALSAEVRMHAVWAGYSGGFRNATFVQAGLGYTFW